MYVEDTCLIRVKHMVMAALLVVYLIFLAVANLTGLHEKWVLSLPIPIGRGLHANCDEM